MNAYRFGQLGEEYAARYLWKKGYEVYSGNYRNKFGEIDLIAAKGKIIAFVEVKTRNKNAWSTPKEAVDYSKQKKIISCALSLLKDENIKKMQPRFDVIEVVMDHETPFEKADINHIKNAFTAEASNEIF